MLSIKQHVRVHSYRNTDRRTDVGRDIVASAMKQIATKRGRRVDHQGIPHNEQPSMQ